MSKNVYPQKEVDPVAGSVVRSKINAFKNRLLEWHEVDNRRQMPWKGERDPYKIWLSEVILQQTRVAQGQPYYERFVNDYPNVHLLAAAPDDAVFKLWEGLGYYSRCANLLKTARYVSSELSGIFPSTIEGLLALKGVGEYTAAAIGSFAFGLPAAVVDGNVIRVLARYFGISEPFDTPAGRKVFRQLAQDCLNMASPAAYNQAIMDFGAEVCTPKAPRCSICPLAPKCFASQQHMIADLPYKQNRLVIKVRHFRYFVFTDGKAILVRKRNHADIWRNLHEFVLEEVAEADFPTKTQARKLAMAIAGQPATVLHVINGFEQQLTHQRIKALFVMARVQNGFALPDYQWVAINRMDQLAFPVLINRYRQQHLQGS